MFHQLTRYVFDQWLPTELPRSTPETAEGVDNTRLTAAETDDEWILVDRRHDDDVESDGLSKASSMESLNAIDDILLVETSPDRVVVVDNLPVSALLRRTSSPPAMEESWFLTPPPCFTSTGPVHMETSPMENLLIEHPSMSVYTHHRRHLIVATPEPPQEEEEDVDEVQVVVLRSPRNAVRAIVQQERQGVKGRQAQKAEAKKACKFVKRGHLDRNNKAREVNSRNRRQRRGERSQGPTRSFANNNRKC